MPYRGDAGRPDRVEEMLDESMKIRHNLARVS